jgi:hypothetical protein
MAGNYYFVIVGHHDNPIFEMEFTVSSMNKTDYLNITEILLKVPLNTINLIQQS